MDPTGTIDVALIPESEPEGRSEETVVATYGHVIVDECDHLSAVSFEKVMKEVKAKYIIGLTATPTRKDGHPADHLHAVQSDQTPCGSQEGESGGTFPARATVFARRKRASRSPPLLN